MARYISKFRRYKITVRKHVEMVLANGSKNVIQQGITCEFKHVSESPVFNHEKELAKRTFKFRGTLQEEDEATPVDPVYGVNSRLGVFDTDEAAKQGRWDEIERRENKQRADDGLDTSPGWLKREVEDFLDSYNAHGRDYIKVVLPKAERPWPTYDKVTAQGRRTIEMVAQHVLATVREIGVDPEQVIAYERDFPRKESEAVIDAMQSLLSEVEPEDELVVA